MSNGNGVSEEGKMEFKIKDIVSMDQDMLTTIFSQCQSSSASSKKYNIYRCKLMRSKCIHTFAGRNDEECRKEMGLHLIAHVKELKKKLEKNPKYYNNELLSACITPTEYKQKYPKAKKPLSKLTHGIKKSHGQLLTKSTTQKRKIEPPEEIVLPKRPTSKYKATPRPPIQIKQEFIEEEAEKEETMPHEKSAMLSAMGLAPTDEVNNSNLARGRIRTRTSLRIKLANKNEEQAKEMERYSSRTDDQAYSVLQHSPAAATNSSVNEDRKYNFRQVMNKNVKSSSGARNNAPYYSHEKEERKYTQRTETVGEIVQLPMGNDSEEESVLPPLTENKMMTSNNSTPPPKHNLRRRKRKRKKFSWQKTQTKSTKISAARASSSLSNSSSKSRSLKTSFNAASIKKERIDDDDEESFFPSDSTTTNANFESWKENNYEYRGLIQTPLLLDADVKHKLHCVLHDHWYWDWMERPNLFPGIGERNESPQRQCVAFGCGRTTKSVPKVALYKFPNPASDKERYEKWVEIVRRTRPSWCGPTSHPDVFDCCVLCELHFSQESFEPVTQLQKVLGCHPILKKDALPSNFFISEKDFLENERDDDAEAFIPSYADLLRKVQEVKNDQFITRDEAIEKLKAIQILMQYQKNKDKKESDVYSMAIKKDEMLVCEICKKMFTSVAGHQNHLREHAGFAGLKAHTCKVCGKSFTRLHSLNYHKMVHNNSTRFKCEFCGRGFRHPSHFKEHLNTHTGEEPYGCDVCNKSFKTSNSHRRHMLAKHSMKTNKGDRPPYTNTSPVTVKMDNSSHPVLLIQSYKSIYLDDSDVNHHPLFEALHRPIKVKVMPLNKFYEITLRELPIPSMEKTSQSVEPNQHPNDQNRPEEPNPPKNDDSLNENVGMINLKKSTLDELGGMYAKLNELNNILGQSQNPSDITACEAKLDELKRILELSNLANGATVTTSLDSNAAMNNTIDSLAPLQNMLDDMSRIAGDGHLDKCVPLPANSEFNIDVSPEPQVSPIMDEYNSGEIIEAPRMDTEMNDINGINTATSVPKGGAGIVESMDTVEYQSKQVPFTNSITSELQQSTTASETESADTESMTLVENVHIEGVNVKESVGANISETTEKESTLLEHPVDDAEIGAQTTGAIVNAQKAAATEDAASNLQLECNETMADDVTEKKNYVDQENEIGDSEILPFVQMGISKGDNGEMKQPTTNQDVVDIPLSTSSDFTVFADDNLPPEHTMKEMFKNNFLDNGIEEE